MSELKNKTAEGLAWGGFFSLLQQLLGVVFGILIARKLAPSDYGMVGMLSIFVALASVLQDSGFVFVLTNRPSVSKKEYSSVFWLNVIISFSVYVLLFIGAPYLSVYYGKSELTTLSRYVFLGFVFSSFGIVQSAYLYKQMRVKERGVASALALIIAGTVGIVMAYNGFGYWGIATQGLLSALVSTIVLWIYSPFRPTFVLDVKFIKAVLPEGVRYALPNFVSAISGNIYSLILGRFYTVSEVGYYNQATKLNTYGFSTTLGMVRNVSQPMLVQLKDNQQECLKAFRKLVRFTAFASFPTMFGLSFVAPELVTILLTPKWLYSACILRILCVGGAFVAINTLFSYYLVSQGRSSLYMYLGMVNSLISIFWAVVASFWGIMSLAYASTIWGILALFIYYGFSKKSLGYTIMQFANDILPMLLSVIIVIGIVYFMTNTIVNPFFLLFTKITMVAILFLGCMQMIHFDIYLEVKNMLVKKIKT